MGEENISGGEGGTWSDKGGGDKWRSEAVMELLSADQCAGGQGSLGEMINIDLMKPPRQEYELTLYTEAGERAETEGGRRRICAACRWRSDLHVGRRHARIVGRSAVGFARLN